VTLLSRLRGKVDTEPAATVPGADAVAFRQPRIADVLPVAEAPPPVAPRVPVTQPPAAVADPAPVAQQSPSAQTSTGSEPWQQNEFWDVTKPNALAPLFPTRSRAWRKTTDKTRIQLDLVLPKVASEPTQEELRLKLARAVHCACQLAFDARSYSALRSSIASLSAFWTAGLVGAALAVVACVRWDLGPLQALVLLGGQAAFLAVFRAFERYVFPGVLEWGFGSERWSYTARLYGRTVVYLLVGVGAMVAVLTLTDRHHHLTWLEHLGLVAPLGCLAVVVGLWTAVGVQALGQLVRVPQDPYPELVTSLLEADYLLLLARAEARERDELVLRQSDRLAVASALERPARALQTDTGMCARVDGVFCPDVAGALRAEGAKVSAGLHKLQQAILAPNRDTGDAVLESLDAAFKNACQGDWEKLHVSDPPAPVQNQPNWLARMGPRIGVAIGLLAAAFAIPAVLGKTLSAGAGTTLTVTLVITALTALAAPSTAVSTVASDIAGLVKPGP
jgi:hypothetical protein